MVKDEINLSFEDCCELVISLSDYSDEDAISEILSHQYSQNALFL